MQTFATVSITCPLGQTHCGGSQTIAGLGSLQVAFAPWQLALYTCPSIEHDSSKK